MKPDPAQPRRNRRITPEPPVRSEAETRMEALLNTAVDGIIVIDEHGCIESFNPAAERIFGYTAAQMTGRNVSRLMPSPHRARHDGYIQHYLETGEARIIGIGREVTGRRADGTLFPMDLAVSEVQVGGRRTFTGIIRDVSERKRLEKAIVDASEMERKQIGQDLHDTVSQQLAGLTMLTRVLQQKIRRRPDEAAQTLAQDANRVAELAATALTQVKNISHGLFPVELERNGLGAALRQLTQQQDALFGVACGYTESAGIPALDGSVAVHLYRIAQEALSNAIKHAHARRIDLCLDRTRQGLVLTVEDDGRGLPPDVEDRGGLGLAIMQYRANMIGAELSLASPPGKGVRVRCTVPSNL